MRKFLQSVLSLGFFAIVIWFFLSSPPAASLPESLFLVASADGVFQPGQRQEIAIQAFSREGGLLIKESGLQLAASLTPQNASFSSLVEELQRNRDGSYSTGLRIPANWSGPARFSIFPVGQPQRTLLKKDLTIRNDSELFLLPPAARIFPGHWVSFRLAVINRKSGQGAFKQPIRAKMTTPFGDTTINRVVFSDIHGTAVFTTHLHDHAAAGIYEFEFSHGSTSKKTRISVWPKPDESNRITNLFNHKAGAFSPLSSDFLQEIAGKDSAGYVASLTLSSSAKSEEISMLSEIRVEPDRAFLTYNAPNSEYRQIEVWQNGRILYSSDLQLDSGRISLPFPHACEPSQPMFFKVWSLTDTTLQVEEKSTLPTRIKPGPAIAMLTQAQQKTDGTEELSLAEMFFTRTGFLAGGEPLQTISRTANTMPTLLQQSDSVEPATASTSRLLLQAGLNGRSTKRFLVIDNELNLGRYRFSAIKIWLSPSRFFSSLIAALRNQPPRIDLLIGEAECRALRFKYLSQADQPAELEKLEGILSVLTELRRYADNNPEIATEWSEQLNRASARLAELIFVPENFRALREKKDEEDDKIGPFSPILPNEISLTKLHSALKPGGKVNLSGQGRTSPLLLSGEVAIHRPRKLPGQEPRLEKLINSRSYPIIVELDFSSTAEY